MGAMMRTGCHVLEHCGCRAYFGGTTELDDDPDDARCVCVHVRMHNILYVFQTRDELWRERDSASFTPQLDIIKRRSCGALVMKQHMLG